MKLHNYLFQCWISKSFFKRIQTSWLRLQVMFKFIFNWVFRVLKVNKSICFLSFSYLDFLNQRHPGPIWTQLHHYLYRHFKYIIDETFIALLQQEIRGEFESGCFGILITNVHQPEWLSNRSWKDFYLSSQRNTSSLNKLVFN